MKRGYNENIYKHKKAKNKHLEIYDNRRVLSKNKKYPTKYAKWNTYGTKKM